jgi:hypothetical protein
MHCTVNRKFAWIDGFQQATCRGVLPSRSFASIRRVVARSRISAPASYRSSLLLHCSSFRKASRISGVDRTRADSLFSFVVTSIRSWSKLYSFFRRDGQLARRTILVAAANVVSACGVHLSALASCFPFAVERCSSPPYQEANPSIVSVAWGVCRISVKGLQYCV